jgi:hypothetical protein
MMASDNQRQSTGKPFEVRVKRFVLIVAAAAALMIRPLAADDRDQDRHGGGDGGGGEHHAAAAPAHHSAPAQHAAPQHQNQGHHGQGGGPSNNHVSHGQGQMGAGHGQGQFQGHGQGQVGVSHGQGQFQAQGQRMNQGQAMGGGHGAPAHQFRTQAAVRHELNSLGVHHVPQAIHDPAHLMVSDRAHSVIHIPENGPGNMHLSQHAVVMAHWSGSHFQAHMSLVARPQSMAMFQARQGGEMERDHYYWHDEGGYRYCHYYDPYGFHWYGWYVGDSCLWVRFYGDRWWNYDRDYDRWMYWNDGRWWWQDPAGVVYLYNDGEYIPTQPVAAVAVESPAGDAGAALNGAGSVSSPDGTRRVKMVSDGSGDAFLYDTTDPPAFSPVYLGSGVQSVRFSDTSQGQPLEIQLTKTDGSVSLVDKFGHSISFNDGAAQ